MLNLARFRTFSTLTANISGTDKDIQNWKTEWSAAFPQAFGKKVRRTLVY